MNEKTFLEVLVGGRYMGMAGMAAMESDMGRMSRMFHDTFVKPFQSPAAAITAEYEKAAQAAQKASLASDAVRQAEMRAVAGRSQIASSIESAAQRERQANLSVEQAILQKNRALQKVAETQKKAYANPLNARANQDYALAKQEKQIAEQRLTNAQMAEKAAKLQQKAARDAAAANDMAYAQSIKKAQIAEQAATAHFNKQQQAAADFERQAKRQAVFNKINGVANMGLGVSIPILGALGYGAYSAAQWQQQVASIGANTNMSAAEQKFLFNGGLNLSTLMPASLQQIGQAYKTAHNAGFSNQNALNLSALTLKSALPTGADPASVMYTLTGLLHSFGYGSDANAVKAARPLLDMIHTAAAIGQMDVGQFANVYGGVAAIGGTVHNKNMPLDTMAALSTLTNMHIPYAQAATQVRGMLMQILNPHAKSKNLLAEMYYNPANAAQKRLFGDFTAQGLQKEGFAGVLKDLAEANLTPEQLFTLFPNRQGSIGASRLISAEGQKLLGQNRRSIANAPNQNHGKGITDYEFNEWLKTAGPQFKLLTNNIHAMEIALGQGLLPVLTKLTGDMIPVVKAMMGFVQWIKPATPLIAALAGGILGLSVAARAFTFIANPMINAWDILQGKWGLGTKALGLLKDGFGLARSGLTALVDFMPAASGAMDALGVAADFALGPWGLLIIAGAALAAGLAVLYVKCKPVHDAINGIGTVLKNIGGWILGHWKGILIGALLGPFAAIPLVLFHFKTQIWNGIVGAAKFVGSWLKGNWGKLLLLALGGPIIGVVANVVLRFKTAIWNGITGAVRATVKWIQTNWWKLLIAAITGPFLGPISQFFVGLPTQWYKWATNAATSFIQGIKDKATGLWDGVKGFFGGVTHFLKFLSPNENGDDPGLWGTNLGKSFNAGLGTQKDNAGKTAHGIVGAIGDSLGSSSTKKTMYGKGQSLGDQIGQGIQDKLNKTNFTANTTVNGTNVNDGSVGSNTTSKGSSAGDPNQVTFQSGNVAPPSNLFGFKPSGGPYWQGQPLDVYHAGIYEGQNSNGSQDWQPAAAHWDYDTPKPGQPYRLPKLSGGYTYRLIRDSFDPRWGNEQDWEIIDPNGNVVGHFTLMHMTDVAGLNSKGQWGGKPINFGSGGQVVGTTGTGNGHFAPHLHVAADQGAVKVWYTQGPASRSQWGGINYGAPAGVGNYTSPGTYNIDWSSTTSQDQKNQSNFTGAAQKYALDPRTLLAIAQNESSGGVNGRMMGDYQDQYGAAPGDAKSQIYRGASYFRWIYDHQGNHDTRRTLALYNMGPNVPDWALSNPAGYFDSIGRHDLAAVARKNPSAYGYGYADKALAYSNKVGTFTPTGASNGGPSGGNGGPGGSGSSPQPDQYGGYPWEYAGVDSRGLPIPLPPKNKTPANMARYWYLRSNIDKGSFQADFGGVNWHYLSGPALQLYAKRQKSIYYDQEQMRLAQVNQWWNGLSPQDRANPAYQNLYHQSLNNATGTYKRQVSTLNGDIASQPLYQDEWTRQSAAKNLQLTWGLVTKPWTLSKKDQQQWLHDQRSLHWNQAQTWADQAKIFARTHKYMKGINEWLKARLHAIWTWQTNADAASLYKLQHHGQTGATGRTVPVHIIGRCAAEAAANVHRSAAAKSSQHNAKNTQTLVQKAEEAYKKYEEMARELKTMNGHLATIARGVGGGGSTIGGGKYRDPRFKGQHHSPSPT